MAYRSKTLRRMSPTARKVARLAGELDSVSRRLKNLVPEFQDLDGCRIAMANVRGERVAVMEGDHPSVVKLIGSHSNCVVERIVEE